MHQISKVFKVTKITHDEKILALSWRIATQPTLYRELALNPYSSKVEKIGLEKFPNSIIEDIRKAVLFAEPEGKYDRNFEQLNPIKQEKELFRQEKITTKTNEKLIKYCNKYAVELKLLSKEQIYDDLFKVVFGIDDLQNIEKKYSKNQRRDFKLLIFNFIKASQHRKPAWRLPFLLITLTVFSLLSVFNFIQVIENKYSLQNQIVTKKSPELPMRLLIPSINVDSSIQYVGITSTGAMEVPSNTIDVGWFDLGPRPGNKGSAVIAGHLNGEDGNPGVFTNLYKLKEGDKLYVKDGNGKSIAFVVRESRIFDSKYTADVFNQSDGTHLNLITCDGVWDNVKKSYSKRLVVFADIVK